MKLPAPALVNRRGNTIKWKQGKVIGKGAAGVVFLGMNLQTGELLAVKQMLLHPDKDRDQVRWENNIGHSNSYSFLYFGLRVLRVQAPRSLTVVAWIHKNPVCCGAEQAESIQHEIALMEDLKHPNIVSMLGTAHEVGGRASERALGEMLVCGCF